jgi:hypothetical protein
MCQIRRVSSLTKQRNIGTWQLLPTSPERHCALLSDLLATQYKFYHYTARMKFLNAQINHMRQWSYPPCNISYLDIWARFYLFYRTPNTQQFPQVLHLWIPVTPGLFTTDVCQTISFSTRSLTSKFQFNGTTLATKTAGLEQAERRLFLLTPTMKMEQSVPKRRHIKFRRRGITHKQEYVQPMNVYCKLCTAVCFNDILVSDAWGWRKR